MIIIKTHIINLKQLIISIAIPLAVGGLSALLTMGSMAQFEQIAKPPLSPPGFLFPIVWTILYTLMGIASYIVYRSKSPYKLYALIFYVAQLAVNFIWSPVFFNLTAYLLAFFCILVLLALVIITTVMFYRIDKTAGILMIPYCIWVAFATYLNFGVYLLN